MTSWNETAAVQGHTSHSQGPTNYDQLDDHLGTLSTSFTERPKVQSWEHECVLAHRQVEDQTMYVVKTRPVWLMAKDIPEEIEAEYWHRYQLNDNARTFPRSTVSNASLKTARDAVEAQSRESRTAQKPLYGSLAEIVNQSRTHSPV
jgi:hypothetical protein